MEVGEGGKDELPGTMVTIQIFATLQLLLKVHTERERERSKVTSNSDEEVHDMLHEYACHSAKTLSSFVKSSLKSP